MHDQPNNASLLNLVLNYYQYRYEDTLRLASWGGFASAVEQGQVDYFPYEKNSLTFGQTSVAAIGNFQIGSVKFKQTNDIIARLSSNFAMSEAAPVASADMDVHEDYALMVLFMAFERVLNSNSLRDIEPTDMDSIISTICQEGGIISNLIMSNSNSQIPVEFLPFSNMIANVTDMLDSNESFGSRFRGLIGGIQGSRNGNYRNYFVHHGLYRSNVLLNQGMLRYVFGALNNQVIEYDKLLLENDRSAAMEKLMTISTVLGILLQCFNHCPAAIAEGLSKSAALLLSSSNNSCMSLDDEVGLVVKEIAADVFDLIFVHKENNLMVFSEDVMCKQFEKSILDGEYGISPPNISDSYQWQRASLLYSHLTHSSHNSIAYSAFHSLPSNLQSFDNFENNFDEVVHLLMKNALTPKFIVHAIVDESYRSKWSVRGALEKFVEKVSGGNCLEWGKLSHKSGAEAKKEIEGKVEQIAFDMLRYCGYIVSKTSN
jgi:hypothetical protein